MAGVYTPAVLCKFGHIETDQCQWCGCAGADVEHIRWACESFREERQAAWEGDGVPDVASM
eukprot:4199135-Alexandrium_andersonii.AAC.1